MIRDALQWLHDALRPPVVEVRGREYGTVPLVEPAPPRRDPFPTIVVSSLTSLVQYLRASVDELDLKRLMILVESPQRVRLVSAWSVDVEDHAERFPRRETIVEANALPCPEGLFGHFHEREWFQVALASLFQSNVGQAALLKVVGNVESGETRIQRDDGITQEVATRTGVATKERQAIQPIVTLAPYRTFREVAQPESSFLFRLQDRGVNGVACALFEADGGAWQLEARKRVAAWLRENLLITTAKLPVLE